MGEIARIESGEYRVSLAKVDLVQTFVETLYPFRHDFARIHHEPRLDMPDRPVYIRGDADILRRIFENLIRNALDHGEGDYRFRIGRNGGWAEVSVCNRAPNLEGHHIERLFDRFYTSDPSRRLKTTGWGLAIAKRLTELLDGKIEAQMKEGHLVIVVQFKPMDQPEPE